MCAPCYFKVCVAVGELSDRGDQALHFPLLARGAEVALDGVDQGDKHKPGAGQNAIDHEHLPHLGGEEDEEVRDHVEDEGPLQHRHFPIARHEIPKPDCEGEQNRPTPRPISIEGKNDCKKKFKRFGSGIRMFHI